MNEPTTNRNVYSPEVYEALLIVRQAIDDMQKSYAVTGRTLSKGEIIKWLDYELGKGSGRNG